MNYNFNQVQHDVENVAERAEELASKKRKKDLSKSNNINKKMKTKPSIDMTEDSENIVYGILNMFISFNLLY